MPERFEFVVVGGGIVGMATAWSLTRAGHPGVLVLEAEPVLAAHQTGRNSGVIHSGLYYKPGSLKARLCAQGRDAMYRLCQERGILHERCGKVVVATEPGQVPQLDELERRGRANGLGGMRRASPEEIREREPFVRCLDGLIVDETGIVSFASVLRELRLLVEESGGVVRLDEGVVDLAPDAGGVRVQSTRNTYHAGTLINCAGLQSDRVARLAGVEPGVRIVPFRGEYYDLLPHARHLVRDLIYPVPDPSFPFLGVHFTRATDGVVEAGPNAVLALAREGYDWWTASWRDLASSLGYPGFWRLARKHWRMGWMEVRRSLDRALFLRALQQLVPALRDSDITPGRAGVRAQALLPDGRLVDDFHIVEAEGMVHVLNAPSPAATASLAIGRAIAERALARGTTHRRAATRVP